MCKYENTKVKAKIPEKLQQIQALSFLHSRVYTKQQKKNVRNFPGGPVIRNLPANSGDTGSIPGPGRVHVPQGN